MIVLLRAICLLLSAMGTPQAYASQAYRMIDLGVLPGDVYSAALGINSSGQVVGFSSGPQYTPYTHAFIWDAVNGMRDLGVLPGAYASIASDINDLGQVVGSSDDIGAFIWDSAGGMRKIDGMYEAEAINSLGQVVGSSQPAGVAGYARLWNPGSGVVDLYRASHAYGINNLGQVVGYGWDGAFIWDAAGGVRSLGTGHASSAQDINDLGQVVGSLKAAAFVWDADSGATVIPGLMTRACGINNAGQVVGYYFAPYYRDPGPEQGAYVWSESTGLIQLWPFSFAYDINDAGQIVGWSGGHAVMWELIPEPTSLAALGLGISGLGLAAFRRRRRRT
ncbi:MAG: hypothetical protein A2Z18_10965 [Armatimonadetes bacterium RBG_16_58_9]|nr:MAG: hypothetical protein A2Z18_10965 [Armatimonadetes bacterium RBG_16_58_9]